ncbi:alpha/beta hydrolase [Amphiplicatus metriothermophilus]|uniref:Acetyl esterase n=1 Tax=Amphiplicatus metriothermophilus TaxID=1519374 RepID=A0A239PL65_9PROT|nr:alpha/beta hydrolase [Amphiplicatus metriothermophilus]MBB5517354.1 acetyl esterase [Amphiplicatus metriothermophilus]SNT68310.1 acetyl esterase [Amphiplicatus metriothermophilus]
MSQPSQPRPSAPTPSPQGEEPDAETAAFLPRLQAMLDAPHPLDRDNPLAAARAKASAIFAAFAGDPEPESSLAIHEEIAPGPDRNVPLRIYRLLTENAAPAPLIVFFHGGGWSLGALDDYDGLLSDLAALSGAAIVSVGYRLAPEHPFPAGLDDARAATAYVARRAEAYGCDPRRLGVMGDSAGGNLAAVIALEARGSAGPPVAAQFLLYPMLDVSRPHTVYPSRLRYGGGAYFLTREGLDASVAGYLRDPSLAADPRVSPMNAPDLSGAPPAYVLAPACDPLRDEAEAYARRLEAAGVPARFDCVPGAIHGFLSFGALAGARAARRALADEIRRLLASA